MKRSTIFFIITFFLLSAFPALADTVIEGNAESNTSVTTNIQGSGEVHTHIESTVNGKTKVLDSNKPGTYTLNNSSSDTTTQNSSSEITPTSIPTPTASASPTIVEKANDIKDNNVILQITNTIRALFHQTIQKMLSIFHI